MRNYAPQKKAWSWSYSKLKNFKTCPFRYLKIDVEKKYQDDFSGEHLAWGKQVHTAFEERVRDGKPFPHGMENFEEAAERLVKMPGTILVEQKLAINEQLNPTGYFDPDAWYRAQADYLRIYGPVALAIDYKTGKILEDAEQLALVAECIFSHYPKVEAVRTEFWWLKDDAATREDFRRADRKNTWRKVMPQVMTLKQAHDTMSFPKKSSGLCRKHCIVTECEHNGQRSK